MIDNRTQRLDLPLPDIDNYLELDVERLKEALTTLDAVVALNEDLEQVGETASSAAQTASQAKVSADAAQATASELVPANAASFTYTGGVLTQMTEVMSGGSRVTSFTYTNGKLTQSVEVFGNRTRTTTYNYDPSGVLTGLTKQDVFE